VLRPDLVDELCQWWRQGLEERVRIDSAQSNTDAAMRVGLHVRPKVVAPPRMRNNDHLAFKPVFFSPGHEGISCQPALVVELSC
jgi:hypothetical protein